MITASFSVICSVFLTCLSCIMFSLRSYLFSIVFFFQAEDGIRDLVRSRGLGDVYKRQEQDVQRHEHNHDSAKMARMGKNMESLVLARAVYLSLIHI